MKLLADVYKRQSLELADSHIFPYSRRSGTPAATMPQQLSNSIKSERAARLNQVAENNAQRYRQQFVGKTLDLLGEEIVEISGNSYLRGHSANYLSSVSYTHLQGSACRKR